MGNVEAGKQFLYYFVKQGKKILINSNVQSLESFSCRYESTFEKVKNLAGKSVTKEVVSKKTLADIGDASIWAESALKADFGAAKDEIYNIFGSLTSVENIMNRSKGALSIHTKLLSSLKKIPTKTFASFQEALSKIGDGIGSRVITKSLDKLSKNDINKMIAEMKFEGKELTYKQKNLLTRYIYQQPIKERDMEEAFNLYERFAQPLVEKRSKEVVDTLTLGVLKYRMMKDGLDIQKVKESGIFKDELIKKLMTDNKIQPIYIKEINNYRGKHGLAEFTDRQIAQLANAMNYKRNGELLVINSAASGSKSYQYLNEQSNSASKAIKASGYRTAQMNIDHANGAQGEIQFRGKYTNMIGEYEHLAYDLRQGKDTLGPEFEEFKKAIAKLDDNEYAKYNEYLESCYNYYNRLELGIPAVKPKLPTRFNRILSEESMQALHDSSEKIQKQLNDGFVPYSCVA